MSFNKLFCSQDSLITKRHNISFPSQHRKVQDIQLGSQLYVNAFVLQTEETEGNKTIRDAYNLLPLRVLSADETNALTNVNDAFVFAQLIADPIILENVTFLEVAAKLYPA